MIRYSIEKINNYYVLFKDVETRHGLCSGGIFRGKRKDCEKYKKELKNDSKRNNDTLPKKT